MSQRIVNPKSGAIPKRTLRQPVVSSTPRPGPSTRIGQKAPTCPTAAAKLKKQEKENLPPPLPKVYENPAFSIPLKKVYANPFIAEREKKKHIRRNIPPSEDTKELKRVCLSFKNTKDITVVEFIGLVAPYTGDNGNLLRTVLTEDMNLFRNLARKIYDTMIRDVSDVLTNQHIQLKEYEQEKTALYTDKMMRAINEIYTLATKFDFESYYENKERYLASLFPVPKIIEADSDEAEMYRRHQAYHRLNWLRTEGDRLVAENKKLQIRLNELKKEQKKEMLAAEEREAEAESKRETLQAQEAEVQQQLEDLNEKVEETFVDTEAAIRVAVDEANILATKKTASKTAAMKKKKRPEWVSDAAAEIDERAVEKNILAEGAQSVAETVAIGGAIKKVRSKISKSKFKSTETTTPEKKIEPKKQRSPFHFSPIKTPPPKPQKPASPFHYSPPKSPIRTQIEETSTKPATQLHTTRVRTERVTVQEHSASVKANLFPDTGSQSEVTSSQQIPPQKPSHQKMPEVQAPPPPRGRRGYEYAPKDTWSGFG